jgi:hypothetical protein
MKIIIVAYTLYKWTAENTALSWKDNDHCLDDVASPVCLPSQHDDQLSSLISAPKKPRQKMIKLMKYIQKNT